MDGIITHSQPVSSVSHDLIKIHYLSFSAYL